MPGDATIFLMWTMVAFTSVTPAASKSHTHDSRARKRDSARRFSCDSFSTSLRTAPPQKNAKAHVALRSWPFFTTTGLDGCLRAVLRNRLTHSEGCSAAASTVSLTEENSSVGFVYCPDASLVRKPSHMPSAVMTPKRRSLSWQSLQRNVYIGGSFTIIVLMMSCMVKKNMDVTVCRVFPLVSAMAGNAPESRRSTHRLKHVG